MSLDPLSVYGQSKLLGEQNIQNSCDNWVIVRVSWLYGEGGKNFVSTMLKAARSGLPEIKVVNDQIGNPTSTVSAAAAIERLLKTDFRGSSMQPVKVRPAGLTSLKKYLGLQVSIKK